jgi:iron complex transport system ATP-binding protein
MAYLPQAQDLQFPFTAREVVLMGRAGHYRFLERDEDLNTAEKALDRLDLHAFAERDYTTLSGGERQRVNLARVLAQLDIFGKIEPTPEPSAAQFLFLDEPNNNLDIRHQLEVLSVAREMRGRGLGVVAVLHDLNQAAQLADHLLVLHQGRLFCQGQPEEALTAETIRVVFGVQPAPKPAKDFILAKP